MASPENQPQRRNAGTLSVTACPNHRAVTTTSRPILASRSCDRRGFDDPQLPRPVLARLRERQPVRLGPSFRRPSLYFETVGPQNIGDTSCLDEGQELDEQPEREGVVDIPVMLDVEARHWNWMPCGGHIKIGNVTLLHGDQIGSGPNVAKKLVDRVHGTAVMGHVRRLSMFTTTSLVTAEGHVERIHVAVPMGGSLELAGEGSASGSAQPQTGRSKDDGGEHRTILSALTSFWNSSQATPGLTPLDYL